MRRRFRYTAGTRTDAAHKGKGYGSNRSREGSHPSSSGRWPAERGRRRAEPSRPPPSTAPPPPRHRDDPGREEKGTFAAPRSRSHGLIWAEPGAIGRGIPLRTATAQRAPLPKEKPRRRRGSKFWDERTQRVVELVPPAPMRNL